MTIAQSSNNAEGRVDATFSVGRPPAIYAWPSVAGVYYFVVVGMVGCLAKVVGIGVMRGNMEKLIPQKLERYPADLRQVPSARIAKSGDMDLLEITSARVL